MLPIRSGGYRNVATFLAGTAEKVVGEAAFVYGRGEAPGFFLLTQRTLV